MAVIDISTDARRVFDTPAGGGIAIFPNDVGYALMGGSAEAVKRINRTRGRGGHNRNAFLCGLDTQRDAWAGHEVARDHRGIDGQLRRSAGRVGPLRPRSPDAPARAAGPARDQHGERHHRHATIRKYHTYNRSATFLRFAEVEVIRIASCHELLADVLRRDFRVELPADPGRADNPSGHLQEFEPPVLPVQP